MNHINAIVISRPANVGALEDRDGGPFWAGIAGVDDRNCAVLRPCAGQLDDGPLG